MVQNLSRLSILGAILAVICLALAGLILIAPGANDRVALFFGILGIALPALLGQLKADQAAGNTNGSLDARIEAGVHRAMSARRRGDTPATAEQVSETGSPIAAAGPDPHWPDRRLD